MGTLRRVIFGLLGSLLVAEAACADEAAPAVRGEAPHGFPRTPATRQITPLSRHNVRDIGGAWDAFVDPPAQGGEEHAQAPIVDESGSCSVAVPCGT